MIRNQCRAPILAVRDWCHRFAEDGVQRRLRTYHLAMPSRQGVQVWHQQMPVSHAPVPVLKLFKVNGAHIVSRRLPIATLGYYFRFNATPERQPAQERENPASASSDRATIQVSTTG